MHASGEIVVRQRLELAGEDEDVRLWCAAAAGDDTAFETLVSRHSRKVASVAARFLHDRDEAEDVVQETFIRAFETRHRYPRVLCVRTWLLRIAINLCRSRRRTAWWRRTWVTGDTAALERAPEDPRELAEQTLLHREIERVLRDLPETLRLPFLLRYYEDLPGTEIAAVLGWNESTV